MRYRLGSLAPQFRSNLLELIRQQGTNSKSCFFALRRDLGMFWGFPIAGAALAGGIVAIFATWHKGMTWQEWLMFWGFFIPGVLAAITGVVVLIRRACHPLRPFLLLTPKVLVMTDPGLNLYEAYRLRDVTEFRSVAHYGSRFGVIPLLHNPSRPAGIDHTFTIANSEVRVWIPQSAEGEAEQFERVLAMAREGVQEPRDAAEELALGLHLIPAASTPRHGRVDMWLLNPAFWLCTAAGFMLLLLALALVGGLLDAATGNPRPSSLESRPDSSTSVGTKP